jgi:hypothetical protein
LGTQAKIDTAVGGSSALVNQDMTEYKCVLLISQMLFADLFYFSNETVQSIISNWYRDLADDLRRFQEQAERVNMWDTQLRENVKVCYVQMNRL